METPLKSVNNKENGTENFSVTGKPEFCLDVQAVLFPERKVISIPVKFSKSLFRLLSLIFHTVFTYKTSVLKFFNVLKTV